MKLTLRTLDQKTFQVEVAPSDTILQVKGKVQAEKGFDPSAQKLVFSGKILSDGQTVAEYGIKETDFVVLMVTAAKKLAAAPAPAPAPATPAAAAPAQPAAAPAPAQPAAPAVDPQTEALLAQLTTMGFNREEAQMALTAAYGNPDRAVEYLMNGIPDHVRQSLQQPRQPAPQAPAQTPAAVPAPAPAQAAAEPPAGSGPFAHLADHENFLQMRMLLQQNPMLLRPFLEEMGRQSPDFIRLVSANQEEFLAALNDTTYSRQVGPPGTRVLSVTPQEKEAIDRLVALGFSREQAIEAYLTCDKNETLAANYLMDNANWE
eukprot:comp19821_c0_seq2/m.23835 comp19821_c0_seq2/g.23835  ORF comp19821_c0_seq2/g.23835 comp19821_c0_seq2/m.23835 type:complete len:318 (-) comp19821_c0_seq2:429-1382(-)